MGVRPPLGQEPVCITCGHLVSDHTAQDPGWCTLCNCKGFRLRRETVNHPQHYGGDTIYEAIKIIEAHKLGFHEGNAVKYILRAEHKGHQLEDLKKARWYIDRRIKQLELGVDVVPPEKS